MSCDDPSSAPSLPASTDDCPPASSDTQPVSPVSQPMTVLTWGRAVFDQLHLAVVFLTRLPMPRLPLGRPGGAIPSLASALWAFPLVGAVVGGGGALALLAAEAIGLPATLSAVAAVAVPVLISGALHEDGLADMADGFGGGATPARKLEIMRDSRIGSYGVVALILLFAVRVSTLAEFPSALMAAQALIVAHALGRMALPVAMVLGRPARNDGLGASAGRPSWPVLAVAVILGLALALVLFPASTAAVMLMIVAVTGAVVVLAHRQIGGYTGDVLGAVASLTEAFALVVLLAAR